MKAPVEQQLLKALVKLAKDIRAMPAANPKPSLLPRFARIDELAKQLPRDTDPVLLHYLRQKSYEKARLFLRGRDEENLRGRCH